MPGYVIHLAVAEQYLKKHSNQTEDYEEFIEGVIFPDSVKDKSETHYGEKSSVSDLSKFLNENDIDTSFKRGYFLHLLTDYLFYNRYIDCISKDIYNDYDILNSQLIEKYNVVVPEKIKGSIFEPQNNNLVILSMDLIDNLIEDISNMDLFLIAKEVKIDPLKWTTMRNLRRF